MQTQKKPGNHFVSFSKTVATPIIRDSILQSITNQPSLFRRSSISTSKSKNQNRSSLLERSRIKELPNYEKYSMGNSLPFIVVFQTIQIQRLSEQVQLQRIKIKECQRLMFNSSSFEVQIKQLSEKCTIYENELSEYRQQLEKMNKICETFYHQNQSLKSKLKTTDWSLKSQLQQECAKSSQLTEQLQQKRKRMSQLQKTKQSEIQQIKSLIEKQRKSMLSRQIKQIEIRHQAQIAQLMIQIRRVSELVESKDALIQELRLKSQNNEEYAKQLKSYQSKINQYEEKIYLLNEQHIKLSQIINLNSTQLQNARRSEFKFNQKLKTDKQLQIEIEHLNKIVMDKEKQQECLRQQIKQLEQRLGRSKELEHSIAEFSNKLMYLDDENKKLVNLIKDKSEVMEKITMRMAELQKENAKYKQYETNLIEADKKCKLLQIENDKMDEINKTKERQVQEYRNKCLTIQTQLTYFGKIEKQKESIQQRYRTQVERIMQLELYIQKTQNENQNLKQNCGKQAELQTVLETLRKENQRLVSRIGQYDKQLNSLKQFEKELGKQYVKMKENDITIAEYQDKFKVMNQQIESLGDVLRTKNQEIIKLQDENMKAVGLINKCKNLQSELTDKQSTFTKIKKELENSQNRVIAYEQKMQEIENNNHQLFKTMNENLQKLQQQLKKRSRQCEESQSKYMKLKGQIGQREELQKMNQKQQNRITVYLRDIEDLRNINKQYEDALDQERKRNQQLSRSIKRQSQTHNSIMDSHRSTQSGKLSVFSVVPENDPQKLLTRIDKLELTIKDLKVKYEDLLKRASIQRRSSLKDNESDYIITNDKEIKGGHNLNNTTSSVFQSNSGSRSMIHEISESTFTNEPN